MEKRVRYALEYKDLVMRASDFIEASIKVNLQALQAENDKRAMDVMVLERDEEIEGKRGELKEGERATHAYAFRMLTRRVVQPMRERRSFSSTAGNSRRTPSSLLRCSIPNCELGP